MTKKQFIGLAIGLLVFGLSVGLAVCAGPNLLYALLDTAKYSDGYSESAFAEVREGMTEEVVIRLLGQPLGKHEGYPGVIRWYGPPGTEIDEGGGLHVPRGSNMWPGSIIHFDLEGKKVLWGATPGQSLDEIRSALGEPIQEKSQRSVVYWRYSWSPPDGHYHRRWIGFDADGRVAEKKSYFYWD